MAWVYLIAAIAAEIVGTSALKASNGFSVPGYAVLSIVAYLISLFLLGIALKVIPVGVAYAIWSGTGVAAIAVIGAVVFGQRLDAAAVVGIGLIVAGVVVLQTLSSAAHS